MRTSYPVPLEFSQHRTNKVRELHDHEVEAYAVACREFASGLIGEVEDLLDLIRDTNDWLKRSKLDHTGHQIALQETLDLYAKAEA